MRSRILGIVAVALGGWAAFPCVAAEPSLLLAALRGNVTEAAVLLDAGANVNARGVAGSTALMGAAQRGNDKVVSLLLGAGADPLVSNDYGWSALMLALQHGHSKVARLLLSRPANIVEKNTNGQSVVSIARGKGLLSLLRPQAPQLLQRAEDQMVNRALTLPKGDNAYETYKLVQEIDPANTSAVQGLRRIAEQYAKLARRELDENNVEQSRTYVQRGLAIEVDNPKLTALLGELDNPVTDATGLQDSAADAQTIATGEVVSSSADEGTPAGHSEASPETSNTTIAADSNASASSQQVADAPSPQAAAATSSNTSALESTLHEPKDVEVTEDIEPEPLVEGAVVATASPEDSASEEAELAGARIAASNADGATGLAEPSASPSPDESADERNRNERIKTLVNRFERELAGYDQVTFRMDTELREIRRSVQTELTSQWQPAVTAGQDTTGGDTDK